MMIKANILYRNISAFCPKTQSKFGHNGHFYFLVYYELPRQILYIHATYKILPIIYYNEINSQNMYNNFFEKLMITNFAIYKNLN